MTILVTGASGFVGRLLLIRNPDFIGLDKISSTRVVVGDVLNVKEFEQLFVLHKVRKIVHLAGTQYSSYVRPWNRNLFFNQNLVMSKTVRDAAIKFGVSQVIYVSTDMVYGSRIQSPVDELSPTNPIGEYGNSKLLAENVLSENNNHYILSILRPRLIMGPGRSGSILKLARLIDSKFPLTLFGNGKNRYQFVSVEDLCLAIELLIRKEVPGVFNIGSDNPPTLDFLFKNVLRKIGREKRIIKVPAKVAFPVLNFLDFLGLSPLAPEQYLISNLDYVLDSTKIKNQLGWVPSLGDEQMLTEALRYHLVKS
jgi:dTDP-glucose 4,6-dehydratase